MNHENDQQTNQGNTSEFERVRNEVFIAQFGIPYAYAQEISQWGEGELRDYWQKALKYFDNLIGGDDYILY